jgi:membrane protein YqaA with SNARE-associated domain
MKYIRKLYDWMLHWAETPYGPLALFIIAFAESSFFPIPPDALLIALALGAKDRSFYFATLSTIGSVFGAALGYAIGYYVWWETAGVEFTPVAYFFFEYIPGFKQALFFDIQELYRQYDFWIVFTAGFTPIPYKVFTIASGAFAVNVAMFLVASTISRGARFFLVAALLWKFGEPIREFIDKYFDWLAIAFTVLLVGGFVLIKFAI